MKAVTRVLLVLGIVTLVTALAFGQAETGMVTGTITDPSGAAVTGATVTVKSTTSGTTRTSTTNATGNYSVTNLRPDIYDVAVTAPNFQSQTRRINVTVGSRNEVSAALAVAGSSTTVEVTAESGAAQVETQSSELSQVVSTQQVQSLPSLTRNPYDFVQTAGNVQTEP
ncbi:MAG TPA: carboxypeptidase-like regulatory domain-containing protein, partial [Terriglobales bacterium]|nr:carboxypeptidase-like regulatory domain-containing protein [Terriglobales bacterium]